MKKRFWILMIAIAVLAVINLTGCGGASPGGSNSGTTLRGTVETFTASNNVRRDSFFATVKNFILRSAGAQVSGVTVSIDDGPSDTTNASGEFTLNNIPTGGIEVNFTEGAKSAMYLLNEVGSNETYVLNDINISGSDVNTAHTGTWDGTLTSTRHGELTMQLTLAASNNTFSGEVYDGSDPDFLWAMEEVNENGTSLSGTFEDTGATSCTGDTGTLEGDFDGATLTGTFTYPAGNCPADSGTFTLTKSE